MRFQSILDADVAASARLRLSQTKGFKYQVSAFLAHSGDSWFWLAAWGITWLWAGQNWHARAALMAVGIVILAVIVMGIKLSVRRRRPEGHWGAIYRFTDPHSFPSGHAARAVLLTILAWGVGPIWLAFILIVWTPLVSLSRVIMGVHYLSDVLAGWVLGVVLGLAVLSLQPFLVSLVPFLFR